MSEIGQGIAERPSEPKNPEGEIQIQPQPKDTEKAEVSNDEPQDTVKEIIFSGESEEMKKTWDCEKVLRADLKRMRQMYPSMFRNIVKVDFVFQGYSQVMKEPYYLGYCYDTDGKSSNLGQFDVHKEPNGNLYVKGPS